MDTSAELACGSTSGRYTFEQLFQKNYFITKFIENIFVLVTIKQPVNFEFSYIILFL